MAKYAPQANYFKLSEKVSKIYTVVYVIILILSVFFTLIKITEFNDFLGVISIVFLAALEFVSQYYKIKAECVRRNDFFDNSFGTNLVHDSSVDYYDNEEMDSGIKKAVANLFENSYFSFKISKKMLDKSLCKNIPFFFLIICLSIYGFSKNQIGISILQLFLSKYFVLNLVKIYRFKEEVERIFNELKKYCTIFLKDGKENANYIWFWKTLLDYETLIAETNIALDTKIYNHMNPQLTDEWYKLKNKYFKEENYECK